eukprot:TRINITY_DN21932_c0_g2_i6.p3 TRINITY_DN21932_c0_g2~~TRINITY_DN21932_c0_g2_i6.p3  ORF type:complete len:194 (-),score=23.20 TRINITY_DN21932_c0_g2_i6:936-1517(-)
MQDQLTIDLCNIRQQLKLAGVELSNLPPETLSKLQLVSQICKTLQCTPEEIQQQWVKNQLQNMSLQTQHLKLNQQLRKIQHRSQTGQKFLDNLKDQRNDGRKEMEEQREFILQRQSDMKFAQLEVESLGSQVLEFRDKISEISVTQDDVLRKKKQLDETYKQIKLLEKELERYEGLSPDINSTKQKVEKLQTK